MLVLSKNARLVFVAGLDLPTPLELLKRELIGRVPIDLVRGVENEGRLGTKISGRFQEIEGAVGVDREINLRIALRSPPWRWKTLCTAAASRMSIS